MTQFVFHLVRPHSRQAEKTSSDTPGERRPTDNPAKRSRVSSAPNAMTATLITRDIVDIHARLDPSTRMDLSLKVLDIGNISITKLLMHRLDSADTCHFENALLSEGGLVHFLKKLVERYPAAEGCIFRAAGHNLTLKKV